MCDPITTTVVGAVAGSAKNKREAKKRAENINNVNAVRAKTRERKVGARSAANRSSFSGAIRSGGAARGASIKEQGVSFGLPGGN